jgi:hypothetical protein
MCAEAFGELESFKILEQQADAAFQEACAEERRIFESESSEKESVKALLQTRAQKDLRASHLTNARKRINLQ